MDINIKTKFNLGDTVICHKPGKGFAKYKIVDIRIGSRSVNHKENNIEYDCSLLTNEDQQETFAEEELFNEATIYDDLIKFMTYPRTLAEARHDVEMYKGLKAFIQHGAPVMLSDNVNWIDYVKWLEEKFPAIEEFIQRGLSIIG